MCEQRLSHRLTTPKGALRTLCLATLGYRSVPALDKSCATDLNRGNFPLAFIIADLPYGPSFAVLCCPIRNGSTSTFNSYCQAWLAMVVSSPGLTAVAGPPISQGPNQRGRARVRSDRNRLANQLPTLSYLFPPGNRGADFNSKRLRDGPTYIARMPAVHAGLIPPTADIQSPNWYQEVDPTVTIGAAVGFAVAAPARKSYTLQPAVWA